MRIKLSKNARRVCMVIIFVAAVALGMVLENLRDNRFVVETISDNSVQSTETVAETETDEPAAAAEAIESDESMGGNDAAEVSTSAPEMVKDGKININTADAELLMELDGIGEKTAQKIIDYREANGDFQNIEELILVNGIGEKKMAALRDKICVE